jgi:hypothetical protein
MGVPTPTNDGIVAAVKKVERDPSLASPDLLKDL